MADSRVRAGDSVVKVIRNDGLAKTINKLRTVPGARNPFVDAQSRAAKSEIGKK